MDDPDWFETVAGDELMQGDLLTDCPVFGLPADLPYPLVDDSIPELRLSNRDLVIVTQSCDIANDKIDEILLARVAAWHDAVANGASRNPALKSREFRRALIAGNIPGLSLLRKRIELPAIPWSVVDFHHLHTLPKPFLKRFAAAAGPRLRLRSPYREHLAQAFARYFMRIGLPHDATEFEQEGKIS